MPEVQESVLEQAEKEIEKQKRHDYYLRTRAKHLIRSREWAQKNPKAKSAISKRWRSKNLDKLRPYWAANMRQRRKENPEREREIRKRSWKKNRDRLLAKAKERYQIPENRLKAIAQAKLSANRIRKEMLIAYGDKCACPSCPEKLSDFLSIDHKEGGGNKHRRSICNGYNTGGTFFYRWLKRNGWPSEFQLLCYNCNQGKRIYGTCPHQSPRS